MDFRLIRPRLSNHFRNHNINSHKIEESKQVKSTKSPIMDALCNVQKQTCYHHSETCDEYILDGICTYLKLGLGVEIAKRVYYSFSLLKRHPLEFLKAIVKSTDYKNLKFLTIYAGLFRVFIKNILFRSNATNFLKI